MQWTVENWDEFRDCWDGVHNFLVGGDVAAFDFELPPLAQIVDEMRRDEMAHIGSGAKSARLLTDNIAEHFRALPIEDALASPFSLAHYRLSNFDKPKNFLYGFKTQVLDVWQATLQDAGFTFERCYPIIFVSGAGCATNYHMDFSHVLAWQIYGQKKFCGLKSPGRFAPHRARLEYSPQNFSRPENLSDDDALPYEMKPGDKLWNAFLTPHWVEASDEVALSINISHGGLRLNGRLCPFERELEDSRAATPGRAAGKFEAHY